MATRILGDLLGAYSNIISNTIYSQSLYFVPLNLLLMKIQQKFPFSRSEERASYSWLLWLECISWSYLPCICFAV